MPELLAEAPLGRVRRELLVDERREDVEPNLPGLARLEPERVAEAPAVGATGLRDDHLRLDAFVGGILEQELLPLLVEARLDDRGERLCVQRIAEREVVRLHRHDVREVGGELEADLELDRLHAPVLDHDHLLHALADEAAALDQERVLGEAARERVAQVEGGREVLDLPRREQRRPLAVDREPEPREEARVLREEPAGVAVQVAGLVRHAEGRPFEDGQRHV